MKKFRLIILVLIGMAVFLAGCPYPGTPTQDPASLQVLTPFVAQPIDPDVFKRETLKAYFKTPYVLQLGTHVVGHKDPNWFATVTPQPYPFKVKYATRPTAFFDILHAYVTLCDGQYYAVAHVINLGGLVFDSAALSVHNIAMSSTSPPLNSPFNQDSNDCPVGKGKSKLWPGEKAYLYQPFEPSIAYPCFNYLITLCSKNNLKGFCTAGGTGVCQYAIDHKPKDTPTPTTPFCDFDCDCEPDQGETEYNCPKDCPKHCGNDACDCGETSESCKKDCGPPEDQDCVCGNGRCESNCPIPEHSKNCPSDCGQP